jgi:hypothetical protein
VTNERRHDPTEGRRDGDQWLGRLVKLIAVIAAVVALFGFISSGVNAVALAQSSVVRIDSLNNRMNRVEAAISAVSYMTCVNFAETHTPAMVPSYCNSAR